MGSCDWLFKWGGFSYFQIAQATVFHLGSGGGGEGRGSVAVYYTGMGKSGDANGLRG